MIKTNGELKAKKNSDEDENSWEKEEKKEKNCLDFFFLG